MKKTEKKLQKNLVTLALFLYSMCMDEYLHNTDVIISFEGILLAKAKICKQNQSTSIALQLIVGNTAFIYNDTAPITKNAILPIIAEGPLALWAEKNLLIATKLIVQTKIHSNQIFLLKIIPKQ